MKKKVDAGPLSPPVRGGQFSVTIVRLAVDLVLQAGASLRGAAAGLSLIATRLGVDVATPSYSAIRSWLLRLGCHALTCPLPSGVWVWLIDHTVQIGACKLLVIVGCLLTEVPLGERPLRQSDLHLVGLALMEHSTQETVAVELERAAQRTGAPRQIVSDQGSDLNGGVKKFQQQHQGTAHVHDLAHQAANVLKQRWSKDERWSAFVARLAQAGAKLRQTREAHLRPPTVRPKARFMNVGPTLRFAGRVLKLLDTQTPSARTEEHYGWLRDYREALTSWTSEQAVAEAAVRHVRTHGVGQETETALATAWSEVAWTAGAQDVAARLCTAVRNEGAQAEPGESLVGSTEALESTFGTLKRLEDSYAGDGFTGLTLALGAIVGNRSEEQVRDALDAVPKKEAEGLVKRLLGTTVQMFRRTFVNSGKA
jgi:hypothetical protein